MSDLAQLTHEPLHERAYHALRDALRSGKFKPGAVLTARGLAAEFGVSATPTREALQRLIAEKALQMLPNRSVIVPALTRARFTEITRIRLQLEPSCAEAAIVNLSNVDVSKLEEHETEMKAALAHRDFSSYLAHNERFHFALYSAARMPFLLLLIEMAWLQIGPGLNILADEGRFRSVATRFHDDIIEFAKARDARAVSSAVHQDIAEANALLAEYLSDPVDQQARRAS